MPRPPGLVGAATRLLATHLVGSAILSRFKDTPMGTRRRATRARMPGRARRSRRNFRRRRGRGRGRGKRFKGRSVRTIMNVQMPRVGKVIFDGCMFLERTVTATRSMQSLFSVRNHPFEPFADAPVLNSLAPTFFTEMANFYDNVKCYRAVHNISIEAVDTTIPMKVLYTHSATLALIPDSDTADWLGHCNDKRQVQKILPASGSGTLRNVVRQRFDARPQTFFTNQPKNSTTFWGTFTAQPASRTFLEINVIPLDPTATFGAASVFRITCMTKFYCFLGRRDNPDVVS